MGQFEGIRNWTEFIALFWLILNRGGTHNVETSRCQKGCWKLKIANDGFVLLEQTHRVSFRLLRPLAELEWPIEALVQIPREVVVDVQSQALNVISVGFPN